MTATRPALRRVALGGAIAAGVLAAAVVAVAVLAVSGTLGRGGPYRGIPVPDRPDAPDVALVDQDGRAFRLADQRGLPVAVYFGYTECPDVCPLTLASWKRTATLLGGDAERVRFVFITVDPERDVPPRLKAYLAQFHPSFIGLTGPRGSIEDALQRFSAWYREPRQTDAHGTRPPIEHSATTYVVDRDGRIALVFRYGHAPEDLAADLARLARGG